MSTLEEKSRKGLSFDPKGSSVAAQRPASAVRSQSARWNLARDHQFRFQMSYSRLHAADHADGWSVSVQRLHAGGRAPVPAWSCS